MFYTQSYIPYKQMFTFLFTKFYFIFGVKYLVFQILHYVPFLHFVGFYRCAWLVSYALYVCTE